MLASSTTLEQTVDVDYILEPLRSLPPLGRRELIRAKRQGRDVDALIAAYWPQHDAAWAEMDRRLDEEAARLGVAPCDLSWVIYDSEEVSDILRRRTPPSRWGARIPHVLSAVSSSTPLVSRPVSPRRSTTKSRSRSRAVRTRTPSRGDPDDPDPERPRLLGDILPGYLEALLKRTGPDWAHDYLTSRRIGREVF